MNAILNFSTTLATDLQQLRTEVELHRQAIEVASLAMERTRAIRSSQEPDITRRMHAMRQRLAALLV